MKFLKSVILSRSVIACVALSSVSIFAYARDGAAQETTAQEDAGPARVVVIGESMARNLFNGFETLNEADSKRFEYVDETVGSSGLVRDDFHDWPASVQANLESWNPDYLVIMVGSNDNQPMNTPTGRAKPRTEKWLAEYRARTRRILNATKKANVKTLWMGVPITKFSGLNKTALQINQILAEEADKTGAQIVDTWEKFSDDNGRFVRRGPNLTGQRKTLRASDGVHFTKDGRRKLAYFALEALSDWSGEIEPVVAEPSVLDEVVIGEAELDLDPKVSEQTDTADVGALQDAPARKPGPVLTLSPAVQPPRVARPVANDAGSARHTLYEKGDMLPFKAGRSDDFFILTGGKLPIPLDNPAKFVEQKSDDDVI